MGSGPFKWPASDGAFWPSTADLGSSNAMSAATTTRATSVSKQPFFVSFVVAGDKLPPEVN
jgi:hypothetical protein